MKSIFFVSVIFFILSSCHEDKIKKMTLLSSISEVSDTLFLARVENLVESDGTVVFIDKYRNQIVNLDGDNWTLNSLVGLHGEGPEELCNLSHFYLNNDTLYALDSGCGKLVVYDLKGNFCAKYPLSLQTALMTDFRLLIEDSYKMNISTRSESGAFVELNLLNNEMHFWGERFEFDYTSHNVIRNGRYLLGVKDGYVSVSDNIAVIEMYNNQKVKTASYDYSDIKTVRSRIAHIGMENLDSNTYGIICEDAYIDGDKLYLLLVANDNADFTVNKVAVFSLFPEIEFETILVMSGKVYSTISVSDDIVFAFDSQKNRLEKYQM